VRPFCQTLDFIVRLQPTSLENRFTLSERFSRLLGTIVEFNNGIEAIGFLVVLLLGLGLSGYVLVSWLFFFLRNGQFLLAGFMGIASAFVYLAAIARSYLAVAVVLGTAAICGVVFLSGAGYALLP
jgi:hypothetical protein